MQPIKPFLAAARSLICALVILTGLQLAAQPCYPDSTFGGTAIVTQGFDTGFSATFNQVLVQPDGKIVVAGSLATDTGTYYLLVLRYMPDGSPDSAFGNFGQALFTGRQVMRNTNACCTLQSNGNIVVVATFNDIDVGLMEFGAVCFDLNGQLNNGFGSGGSAFLSFQGISAYVGALAVDSSGRLVMGGYASNSQYDSGVAVLAVFTANGAVDSSFGNLGTIFAPAGPYTTSLSMVNALVVQADGKIVAGGRFESIGLPGFTLMMRFNTNGTADSSYGNNGISLTNFNLMTTNVSSMVLQSNGKVVALIPNSARGGAILMRFSTNGTIDTTFGNYGTAGTQGFFQYGDTAVGFGFFSQMISDSADRLYLGLVNTSDNIWGNQGNYLWTYYDVEAYSPDGQLDSTFGAAGVSNPGISIVKGLVNSIARQPDGKFLLAGSSQIGGESNSSVARFITTVSTGIVDIKHNDNAILVYPNPLTGPFTLRYQLNENRQVSVELCDLQGRLLCKLLNHATRPPGENTENMALPQTLAAGNYLLKVIAGAHETTLKIVKIK